MTQPLERSTCDLPALGEIDSKAGEFWYRSPFQLALAEENLSAFERNRTFINLNGERFLDASFASGADLDSDSRSVIVGDFDRDGAEDLLVVSIGGGPLRLFRNRFPDAGHRVRIELIGRESNRSGIGARVVANVDGRRICRDLFPANGFMGQSPAELFIGLGSSERIDRLTVEWPSGEVQQFEHLPADRKLTITEGDPDARVSGFSGHPSDGSSRDASPQSSRPLHAPLAPGAASPDLIAHGWLNGPPPTRSELAGKVVVLDVWSAG